MDRSFLHKGQKRRRPYPEVAGPPSSSNQTALGQPDDATYEIMGVEVSDTEESVESLDEETESSHDPTYTPPRKPFRRNTQYSIYASRKHYTAPEGASDEAKKRARVEDPHGGKCLLTLNFSPESTVDACHLLAQKERRNRVLLMRLEWMWSQGYMTLHVDEPWNLFFLDPNLHRLFDSSIWAMLPCPNLVAQLVARLSFSPDDLPDIVEVYGQQRFFEYRMICLATNMTCICRLNRPGRTKRPAAQTKMQRHSHPFNTLPPLISHVLPHFVIVNTGAKLEKLQKLEKHMVKFVRRAFGLNSEEAAAYLEDIVHLYCSWRDAIVPEHFSHQPEHSTDESDNETSSEGSANEMSANETSVNETSDDETYGEKPSDDEDNLDDEASVNDLIAERSRGRSPDEIDFLSCYYQQRAVYDHGELDVDVDDARSSKRLRKK